MLRMKRYGFLVGLIVIALAGSAHAQDVPSLIRELGLKEADAPVRTRPGWKTPKKFVLMANGATPERLAWMQEAVPKVKLVAVDSPAAAIHELKDADGLVSLCVPEVLRAAPKLRWMQVFGAGVEYCAKEELFLKDRTLLTNLQRVSGSIMAEHVIATMMAMTRGLPHFVRAQEREDFVNYNAMPPLREVKGRTILVAGLGGIGMEVARRAHALGMTVIATRHSSTEGPDYVSYVGKSNELLDLTAKADVVVNAMPLTQETRFIFNKDFFARMKKDAYFINVGRGESVEQESLIAALNEGRIAGAALDVMTPEPLPKGHPLWQARNLLITPHMSAQADDDETRWVIIREQMRRYAAGEKMLSVVDAKRGY